MTYQKQIYVIGHNKNRRIGGFPNEQSLRDKVEASIKKNNPHIHLDPDNYEIVEYKLVGYKPYRESNDSKEKET